MLRLALLWLPAICLATLQTGWAQTYPVTWEQTKSANVIGTTIQRPLLATNKGMATSQEWLYGSDKSISADGSFEHTINDLGQIKRIGFAVVNGAGSVSDKIDYGFSFLLLNGIKAFSPANTATNGYLLGTTIKVARVGDKMRYYVNGTMVMEETVDSREQLAVRVELTSLLAKFSNVTTSFSSKRLLVSPAVNNTANSINLTASNGTSPYRYAWGNGSTKEDPNLYFDDTYTLSIADHDGYVTDKAYSVGTDVTWSGFSGCSQSGDVLQKTSGSGWGHAYSSVNFNSSSPFWTEYIAENESAQKAFGIAGITTTVSSFTDLLAGFLVSDENFQIVYNGAVIETYDYYDNDALHFSQDGGLLHWKVNGVEIYRVKTTLPTQFRLAGLVKVNGTLDGVNYQTVTSSPAIVSWDAITEQGSVMLDLSGGTGALTGPYHYFLSAAFIPSLDQSYLFLRDTLLTDPDSIDFFTGDFTSADHLFDELPANRYFVTAFGSDGERIFGKWLYIQPQVSFYQQSNLVIVGNKVVATADGIGFLKATTPLEGDYVVSASYGTLSGTQFFGLCPVQTAVTSYQQLTRGFYLNDKTVQAVVNGVLQGSVYAIREGDYLYMEKSGSTLSLRTTAAVLTSFEETQDEILEPVFSLKSFGVLYDIHVPSSFAPFQLNATVVNGNCGNPTGSLSFQVVNPYDPNSHFTMGYSVTDLTNNFVVEQNFAATTNTVYVLNNLPPGTYRIAAQTTIFPPPLTTTYSMVKDVYVGVETSWTDLSDYTTSPNTYSLQRGAGNAGQFSYARSQNFIQPGQNGWITFTPKVPANNSGVNYFRLSSNYGAGVAPATNETYLGFMGFAGVRIYCHPSSGATLPTYVIPTNSVIRIQVTSNIKVYVNNVLRYTIPRPAGGLSFKGNSIKQPEGFLDVLSSFGCSTDNSDHYSYFEVKKTHNAGYATAVNKKLKFILREEYQTDPTLKMAYVIYDEHHQPVASCSSAGVSSNGAPLLSYQRDDNRHEMNLSAITGLTTGHYYYVEITTSTKETRYFKFFYKN